MGHPLRFLLRALVATLLLGATASWAQACGPFRLAFYEFGLLYYRDAQGSAHGIDLDLVEALKERSGCQIQTTLESRVRIWTQLADGQLDLSVSGIPSPERERFAEFIPYISTRNMLVARRSLPADAKTPAGFLRHAPLRVAVVKSFRHGAFFDEWLERLRAQGARVVETADFESVVRLFKAGRVDAFLALPTSWILAARQHKIEDIAELLDWAPQERILAGLIVSRHTIAEADRRRLRAAVHSLLADGSVDAILRRHVSPDLAVSMRVAPPPSER